MTLKEFNKKLRQAATGQTNNYEKLNIYFNPLHKKYDKVVDEFNELFFEIQDALMEDKIILNPKTEEEWEGIELTFHKMKIAQDRMHDKIYAYFEADEEFDDIMDECQDADTDIEIVSDNLMDQLNQAIKLLNALTLSINKLDKDQIQLMEEVKVNYEEIIKFKKKIKI